VEKNDISNEVTARLLIVFEGLLGTPPEQPKMRRRIPLLGRKGLSPRDIEQWLLNEALARRIWDVTWRQGFSVDVVTFLGEEFVTAISDWIDIHDLPVGHVSASSPDRLARSLAYQPNVAAVYDPEPSRWATYGSKGRIMDPGSPRFF
jgi:hypothetical protein